MLTAQMQEEIYDLLCSRELFREEQKGCHTLKGSKTQSEKSNYGMNRIQKGIWYVSQSWIIESLKMYKICDEVMKFNENTVESNSRQEKNPARDLSERCTINITICKSDDATQFHIVYAQTRICPGEREAQNSMGF